MSRKLDIASAIALVATFGFTCMSADGSGAAAQARSPQIVASIVATAAEPENHRPDNLLPDAYPAPQAVPAVEEVTTPDAAAPSSADTLAELVAQQDTTDTSRELECLAGAVYFEAKSETLAGQLAVGRVVVNRAHSGRFPTSYCGVVYQQSQFSFVRGKAMPAINRESRGWKTAVAIARIADEGSWHSTAEGALFFHAARVSPAWRLTKIARVDNHVFYR